MASNDPARSAEILDAKRKRLHALEVIAARQGHDTRAEITVEIEDLRQEVAALEAQLAPPAPAERRIAVTPAAALWLAETQARLDAARRLYPTSIRAFVLPHDGPHAFDFGDWCERVLDVMARAAQTTPAIRRHGITFEQLAAALFGSAAGDPAFPESLAHRALESALIGMAEGSLLIDRPRAMSPHGAIHAAPNLWRLAEAGRSAIMDIPAQWAEICRQPLFDERADLLLAVNRLSMHVAGDYAWTTWLAESELLAALQWNDADLLWAVADELDQYPYLLIYDSKGPHAPRVRASYAGIIRERRIQWFDVRPPDTNP